MLLKIKNDVNLNVLKKYGFEENQDFFFKTPDIKYEDEDGCFEYCWWVDIKTRTLKMYIYNDFNYYKLDTEEFNDEQYATVKSIENSYTIDALIIRGLDIIYDLIHDRLVEKV